MFLKNYYIFLIFLFFSYSGFSQNPNYYQNIVKEKNIIKTKINDQSVHSTSFKIIKINSISFDICSNNQIINPQKQRSTISIAGGATSELNFGSGKANIQQSIGQSSVIGTFKSGNYTIHQGFIIPKYHFSPKKTDNSTLLLNTKIYPNPFNSILSIEIQDVSTDYLIVEILDVNGNIIFSRRIKTKNEMTFNLDYLQEGIYFIQIWAGNKSFFSKIIKR